MPINPSLSPIREADFGPAQARHLLSRAGYGGTPQDLFEWQSKGLDTAVQQLVQYNDIPMGDLDIADLDPDVIRKLTAEERREFLAARREGDQKTVDKFRRMRVAANAEDRRMHAALQRWWVERMAQTPRPTEERLTMLWHCHFATRHRDVRDAYLMEQQNNFLREHANGSFRELASGIVQDPAMIKFLNNDQNRKQRPNENLSRELMELFTLGEGHYTEDDIKAGARALTGYHIEDNDFVFNERQHDTSNKTILGSTDKFTGSSFVELLLAHEACSRFIALKLYRHFVADVSDDWDLLDSGTRQVVDDLAKLLRDEDFELVPVLTRLFKSRHFYDAGIVGKQIKSPVQIVIGTIHQTHAPLRSDRAIATALRGMGQQLFEPPSVAGWEGGKSWINTSTLFMRQNTCAYLLTGTTPGKTFKKSDVDYNPMPLIAQFEDEPAKVVVDRLCDAMLGHHVGVARREPLVKFMEERSKGVTADALVALLLLITAMPEYQLC
ncbi:MAG: DUF1800 domain-containing protein [Planctomycetota bacterium]